MPVVDKNLVSSRNLQDSGVGPLRKFYGDLEDYLPDAATGYEGTRILLRFTNLKVLQATEPYPYPVTELNIGYSQKKHSKWGFFSDSLTKFLKPDEDIKDCIKRNIGMVYTDGLDGRPVPKKLWDRRANNGAGAEKEAPAWEVFEIVGSKGSISSEAALEHAKALLDGKSLSEFNKVAFADENIRGGTDLQRSITDRSFINSLLQLGEFTKDSNDIYHRTKK